MDFVKMDGRLLVGQGVDGLSDDQGCGACHKDRDLTECFRLHTPILPEAVGRVQ